MEEGKVIKEFTVLEGRLVVLRTPKPSDLDGLLELINSLVEEKAQIMVTKKVTREQEREFLNDLLLQLKNGSIFFVVAVSGNQIVASSDLQTKDESAGTVGLVVKNGFRGLGIGTEILRELTKYARSVDIKKLTVKVFATNSRAIHLYKKLGFTELTGSKRRFDRDDKSVDELTMVKQTA